MKTPPVRLKRPPRLSRKATAALARLRLQWAFTSAAGGSHADIETAADTAVKDLLFIGAIAYPGATAQLLGAVIRLLLVQLLENARTRETPGLEPGNYQ